MKPFNEGRQSTVRVRPLVNLIGERDHDAERQEEGVGGVPRPKLLPRLMIHDEGEESEEGKSDEAVVSVGLDEVVTGDGQGVDVVLSEWSDEGLCVCVWGGGRKCLVHLLIGKCVVYLNYRL